MIPNFDRIKQVADEFAALDDTYHLRKIKDPTFYIGGGSFRSVFGHIDTSDVVYKIGDPEVNISEFLFWKTQAVAVKRWLAPMYYTNGFVNVMKKMPYGWDELDQFLTAKRTIVDYLAPDQIIIPDLHTENLMFWDESRNPLSAKVVDYAINGTSVEGDTLNFEADMPSIDLPTLFAKYPSLKNIKLITYFDNL